MMTLTNENPNFLYLLQQVPKQDVVLLQGGTRSGKTWSVCKWIVRICYKYRGLEIDIVRDSYSALKSTIWKDFFSILVSLNLYDERNHNKTDHIYDLFGNAISFYGADNPEKIHGRTRDILIINEAHQFPPETVDQLFPRTRHKIIADYNPALGDEHWLDPYIDKYPPLKTTYRDNPFLTKRQIRDIESRKGNPWWWPIYGAGERTKPLGVIFPKWETGDFPDELEFIFGQDYGFVNDPTTLIKIAVDEGRREIYLHECFCLPGLSTDEIAQLNHAYAPNRLIVGDSAEPRLINELQAKGCYMQLSVKGQGSVTAGISKMNDYKIIVTEESTNLKKELNTYKWADKKTKVPEDKNNHCIDAARYAYQALSSGYGSFDFDVI